MARQIKEIKAILIVDEVGGTGSQVLNSWTVNDSGNPLLTKPGAATQRAITSAELTDTLSNFLQGLLSQANSQEAI